MAICHFSIGHISRSTGRSAVQAAAYITGSCLYETRRDLTANYENRAADVVWSKTFAPEWAPAEFHELSVWDKLETFEDEYSIERYPNSIEARDKYADSARTALTYIVALPRELPSDVSIELITAFVEERFLTQGLIITAAMHDDEGNPHAHLQISRRTIEADGTFSWAKNRSMCTKKELLAARKMFVDFTNRFLEREGFECRITEKSFADLGVKLLPTKHRGWYADKLADMGIESRITTENQEIFEANKQRIIDNPTCILNEITATQATFTQFQLLKAIQKRIGDDSKTVGHVFEHALKNAMTVGVGIDGHVRYTSSRYKEKEEAALVCLEQFQDSTGNHGVTSIRVDAYLADKFGHMSEEQHDATLGLIQNNRFSMLIGRAGTGKTTTTIKAVCDIYQQAGFKVIGTSLSALASENLGNEADINAKTVMGWLTCWERYASAQEKFLSFDRIVEKGALEQYTWYKDLVQFEHLQLTSKSVLIVDEAGMIGTSQWHDILSFAHKAGAKVIAVGDDNQFSAIEAGDFFRELKEQAHVRGQLFSLNTIRRQKVEWMRQASHSFAELNIQQGLSMYEQNGHIHQSDLDHLEHDVADAYISKLADGKEGVVLAFTNKQTDAINLVIRQKLRQRVVPGHILSDHDFLHIKDKGFALGDKVVFLKNDKEKVVLTNVHGQVIDNRFIKNGTTGILERVTHDGERVVVRLDQDTTAHFSVKDYDHLSYGYASTTHKYQGQTVDFALLVASRTMDAKGLYVAMTRHRYDAHLFYAKEDFADFKALALRLSRFDNKDLAKDYTIRPEHTDAWARVQEYQHCIYDAAAIYKESSAEGDTDWKTYRAVKMDQIKLGKEIMNDYENHKLYLNQAGLTQEMLHITTGVKARPLSHMEEKAKLTVEIYGETAKLTRALWHEIRKTYPSTEHPHYASFQEMRNERDALAKDILDNYPLHREFVTLYAKEYGISKKTLENQIAYRAKAEHALHGKTTNREMSDTTADAHQNVLAQFAKTTQPSKDSYNINDSFTIASSKPHVSFEKTSAEIVTDLTANVKDLALHFLGKPNRQNTCHWRYGKKGSISIAVNGKNKGMYSNFESGVSGNVVTLISDQLGLNNKEAFKWGVQWLGYDQKQLGQPNTQPHLALTKTQDVKTIEAGSSDTWTPIFPVHAAFPDLKNTPSLLYMLKSHHVTEQYSYKDADGHTLGYVVRLEDKEGNKITPTLTYCRNDKGEEQWRWKGFGEDRPLYGIDQLKLKPTAPVLIVEGEKTCEAARVLFPDHAVITWSGGCGSVQKSDWSVLNGKEVTIWPDHDTAGINAAHKIGVILTEQGHKAVHTVDLPSTLPHKWDLADKSSDGIAIHKLLNTTLDHASLCERMEEKENTRYLKTFSYAEITAHAKSSSIEFLMFEKNEPLIIHVANETLRELHKWHALTGKTFTEQDLQKQASLTGVYTAWSKAMLDSNERNVKNSEKAIMIGAIAAKSKVDGIKFGDENGRMYASKDKFQEQEDLIQQHLKNPPSLIKDCSPAIQEEMLRAVFRCRSITDGALPSHITKECVDMLEKVCPHENDSHIVRGVIKEALQQKAKGLTLTPIKLEKAGLSHMKDTALFQKAVEQSHQKGIQMEHQKMLESQPYRGFER